MSDLYETPELVSQYLHLHFGTDSEILPPFSDSLGMDLQPLLHFPQTCAKLLLEVARTRAIPLERVLDLGCSVGGASFALSEQVQEVVGIDLSAAFIHAAEHIKNQGTLPYQRKDQGDRETTLLATLPPGSRPHCTTFRVGDACRLPDDLHGFDAVLMANLLCRLPTPRQCLTNLHERSVVRTGGLLALASPYSWLPE